MGTYDTRGGTPISPDVNEPDASELDKKLLEVLEEWGVDSKTNDLILQLVEYALTDVKPVAVPPLEPGGFVNPPENIYDLVIESLRYSSRVGLFLNEIAAKLIEIAPEDDEPSNPDLTALINMTVRRFSDCSGLHLHIAATNIGIPLPDDLKSDPDEDPF